MKEEEIFHQALARGRPEERAAFLEQACAGDPALRASVEALLRANVGATGFLDQPAPAPVVTVDEQPVGEGPGSVIGSYKLLEQIGEGGFGVVFMAEQTQPVRRKVALKVLKPGMDTRQVVARFEAERQALAIMDHPNIARVFDGGATQSGRPYFVMELVKGVPITEFCDQNHLTPRQRLELFVPVCHAVQHAHQKGIIHRDLKPSNVLVTMHDTAPVVKVIDFGVAKALGQELTDKTLFTGFAQMVGTPLYMSPEQAGQSGLDIDTRSDIYSLGVLLYELLTGTTPFTRERFKKAAYDEIRRIIREEEPPRPSTRLSESKDALPSISAQRHTEPAKLTKLVRGELDWIVMKALEKDRNRRYETANGFAMDVQRYLADEPVQACPPSVGYRLRKFARRHKAGLVLAGLILLILLAVTGGIGWNVRDRAARQAAVEREVTSALKEAEQWQEQGKWPEALSAAKRAEGLLAGSGSDELRERVHQFRKDLDMVLRLDDIRLLSSDKFDFERSDQAYAQAFADYGIDVERLPADEAGARIRGRPGVATALTAALDDWAYCRSSTGKTGSLALTAVAQSADPDAWRRQVREAHKQKDDKALAALAASPELLRQPPITLLFLASAIGLKGDIELLRQAQRQYPGDFWINVQLAIALRRLVPPYRNESVSFMRAALAARPQSTGTLNLLGFYLDRQGKHDEAIDTYRRALQLDPKFTWARLHLGMALQKQRKADEAIDCYRKAIELDPKSAAAHIVLGNALVDQKKMDEAFGEYRKAIELDPKYVGAYTDLGKGLYKQKKLAAAAAAFLKAIELNPNDAVAHYNLGVALAAQQKLPEAIDAYRKVIELDPKNANAHVNIGGVLRAQKKLDEAAAEHRKAIDLEPKLAPAHYNLGTVLSDQGKRDKAIEAYRKAVAIDPNYAVARKNLGIALMAKGWNLANHPDPKVRDFKRAVELSKEAVEVAPESSMVWQFLGWIQYRLGNWKASIEALEKSCKLQAGGTGDGGQWIVMALAHGKLGNDMSLPAPERAAHKSEARRRYDDAVKSIDRWSLGTDSWAQDIRAFRAEGADLLGVKEQQK
jgi:serine/threonine protein kinase/Tfp pilus assembly protein PilF